MRQAKPMMQLRATRTFKYDHRMLQAGDLFEAKIGDGRVLIAAKRARLVPAVEAPPLDPPPAALIRQAQAAHHPLDHDRDGRLGGSPRPASEDLAPLRDEYERVVGRRAFNGWDAAELRRRIAESAPA
jgi:hypothetical protein